MAEHGYKIIDVNFSTRSEVTATSKTNDPFGGTTVTGDRKRTTYLDAHITFDCHGQAGSAICPIQTLSVVEFDEKGDYTSVTNTPLSFDSISDIEETIRDCVEKEILSMNINNAERSHIHNSLNSANIMKLDIE